MNTVVFKIGYQIQANHGLNLISDFGKFLFNSSICGILDINN